MNQKQLTRKLKFEKPQVCSIEFLGCGLPMLTPKFPAAIAIAAACNVPHVAGSLPLAVAV